MIMMPAQLYHGWIDREDRDAVWFLDSGRVGRMKRQRLLYFTITSNYFDHSLTTCDSRSWFTSPCVHEKFPNKFNVWVRLSGDWRGKGRRNDLE